MRSIRTYTIHIAGSLPRSVAIRFPEGGFDDLVLVGIGIGIGIGLEVGGWRLEMGEKGSAAVG